MGGDKTERERRLTDLQSALLSFYDLMTSMQELAIEFNRATEAGEEKDLAWFEQWANGVRDNAPGILHTMHRGNVTIQELIDECRERGS